MTTAWSIDSWKSKPIVQHVDYPPMPTIDTAAPTPNPILYRQKEPLETVLGKLEKLPPIVSAVEVSSSSA